MGSPRKPDRSVRVRIREAINRYDGIVEDEGAVRRFGRDGSLGLGQRRLDLLD